MSRASMSSPPDVVASSTDDDAGVVPGNGKRIAPWESMSFACGGWLQFYLFGVARAIQAKGLDRGVKYLGCSAGSLAALGLALGGDFDKAVNFCKDECIPKAFSELSGLFKIDQYVARCLDFHCEIENWHELKPGDLSIAMTRLPFFSAERATCFSSKEDLRACVLASCGAFPAAAIVHVRGAYYLDGGLSDFQPVLDEKTVTVSPFYFSDCDIKPSRYVPFWWAVIPPKSADTIDWLYNLGWEDAMRFIDEKQLPDSPEARPHLTELSRNKHHYDVPKRVTMHRFLGYQLADLAPFSTAFLFDLVLLILFVTLIKPVSLIAIYLELFLRANMSVAYVLLSGAFGFSELASKSTKTLKDCLACILSLSLLMRLFSLPSTVVLRKHDRLSRVSLLYRVLSHIM